MRAVFACTMGLLFLLSFQAFAEIPSNLHFSGVLKTSDGILIDCPDPFLCETPVSISLSLYTEPEEGTAVYTEFHESVFVDKGVFNIPVGVLTPLEADLFNNPLFLGISINGDSEALPRLEVYPVPTSLLSKNTEKLGGLSPEQYVLQEQVGSLTGPPGQPGEAGSPGLNALVSVEDIPSGDPCSAGGVLVLSGLDTNQNGILDSSEVTSSHEICNGEGGGDGVGAGWVNITNNTQPFDPFCFYMAQREAAPVQHFTIVGPDVALHIDGGTPWSMNFSDKSVIISGAGFPCQTYAFCPGQGSDSSSTPVTLVGGVHTSLDCEADGGVVTSIGSGESLCKFVAGSCPSGWSQVNNWTTTVSSSCTGVVVGNVSACPPPAVCSAFGHPFADLQPQECCVVKTCGINDSIDGVVCSSGQGCGGGPLFNCCQAAVIEVGCQ